MGSTDLSNTSLGKFLSAEMLVTSASMVFLIGVSWATLSSQAEATEDKVRAVEERQEQITRDISTIKGDLKGVRAEQSHSKEDIAEIKGDLKEVLKELRDR